ncbi:hypothetical protein [Streptomyces sp. NPDC101234]|uniref:hypothetical protein n=1 Tax=Streptomyces sp. NPDC101234 TaxID=3366138 RepID=UPI0038200E76
MTTEASNPIVVRRAETGWARARRLRGQGIQTCVRATLDNNSAQLRQVSDWNVVRDED